MLPKPMFDPFRRFLGSFLVANALGFGFVGTSSSATGGESFPEIRFGPYVFNEVQMAVSPSGNEKVLPNGGYRLQIGWIEPIALDGQSYASCTFLETDVHADITPYQTDLGTTFSLKPFRLFELGLTYNRLVFNQSLKGFNGDSVGKAPQLSAWTPSHVLATQPGAAAGADIFTFTGALHIENTRASAYLSYAYSLWDVDLRAHEFLYEFENDLLIKRRDRVHAMKASLDAKTPHTTLLKPFTIGSVFVRDRYWFASHTRLEKNLVEVGFAGLRLGHNSSTQKRGLDLSLGLFTHSPQLDDMIWWRRLYLSADWKWTIDFLSAKQF